MSTTYTRGASRSIRRSDLRAGSLLILLAAMIGESWMPAMSRGETPPREVIYRTPVGTVNKFGQDISGEVVVTFMHNAVRLTITNTTSRIVSPEQCITGVSFLVHTKAIPHLAETAGRERVLFPTGFYTSIKPQETRWTLAPLGGGKFKLMAPEKSLAVINDPEDHKAAYTLDPDGFERMSSQNPFLANGATFEIRFPESGGEEQLSDWVIIWGSDPNLYGADDITPRTSNTGDAGILGGGGVVNNSSSLGGGGGNTGGGGSGGGGGNGTPTHPGKNPLDPTTFPSLYPPPTPPPDGGGSGEPKAGGTGGSGEGGVDNTPGATDKSDVSDIPTQLEKKDPLAGKETPLSEPPNQVPPKDPTILPERNAITGVPEPTTLTVLGLCAMGLVSRRRPRV